MTTILYVIKFCHEVDVPGIPYTYVPVIPMYLEFSASRLKVVCCYTLPAGITRVDHCR